MATGPRAYKLDKTCEYCTKPFRAAYHRAKYCSDRCRTRNKRLKAALQYAQEHSRS